jgi:tetratricopeptide (TPR) repeat protein
MNQTPLAEDGSWPLSLALYVEQVCSRFEADFGSGSRPAIKSYLGDTPEPVRSVLLRELLALELEYRWHQGDSPTPEEYYPQLPDQAGVIREIFGEVIPWQRRALAAPSLGQAEDQDQQPAGLLSPSERTGPYLAPETTGPVKPRERTGAARRSKSFPTVPGYEILSVLGRGGMGIVYKARQVALKRLVALKMLREGPHAGGHELARFRSEAEAVARLQHPHIVQIYEVGEHDGVPYFSLEFVDGGSLKDALAGAPLPAGAAAALVETLARAIQAAHQRGIIHRDLKPANILLASGGREPPVERPPTGDSRAPLAGLIPKIADFGLAKRLDGGPARTHSGAILGTPSYMAPEQTGGRGAEVGPAADVYALGAILYEALTGRPPFRAATALETLEQVRGQEPVPPGQLQPKLLRDLETICLKCLQKEPRNRYASAEALAEDLRRFLAGEPIRARPVGLWERGWKKVKRRPAAAALWGVCAAALLALVAGVLLYQEQRARLAEKELAERVRSDAARARVQELLRQAEEAAARGNWQEAQPPLASARALLGSEPSLADLRGQVEGWHARVAGRLQEQAAARRARDKQADFFRLRDEAVFHGTLFTGLDVPANLRRSAAAARQALALFGVSAEPGERPVLEACFTTREKADLTSACYELCLILAETLARQDPPQLRQAVGLLDRAAKWGPTTRAYHLRHGRYMRLLGDDPGAAAEAERAARCRPAGALDYFLTGEDWQRQGHLGRAIAAFESALRLRPDHFWARYLLAVCYLKRNHAGELQAAKACLTACLVQKPGFVWLYVLRGFAHGQLEEFPAAARDFQEALGLSPNPEARYAILVNRGALAVRQRKFAEAIADFQAAIGLQPDRYQAYLNLAHAYQRQQKLDLAVAQLNQAVDRARPLLRANQLEPSALAFLYHHRAWLHWQRRDLDAALADFGRAVCVPAAAAQYPLRAQDHACCGRIRAQQQRHHDAVRAYDTALRIDPTYAEAYRWRAEALVALGRWKEARAAFDQALARGLKPQADFYLARGLTRAHLKDYPGALDDYTLALTLKPEPAVYVRRGWVHLVNESLTLARHDFDQALRLDPKHGEAHAGRGYVQVKLGHLDQAVADAEKAVQRGPQTPRLLWNAARIAAQVVGRLEADPKQRGPSALDRRLGCQEQALKWLRRALEKSGRESAAFWRRYVQEDVAFNPIRQSPGFKRLAADYASAAE